MVDMVRDNIYVPERVVQFVNEQGQREDNRPDSTQHQSNVQGSDSLWGTKKRKKGSKKKKAATGNAEGQPTAPVLIGTPERSLERPRSNPSGLVAQGRSSGLYDVTCVVPC